MQNKRISSGQRECCDELRLPVDNPDSLSSKHDDGVVRHEDDRPLRI